MKVIIQKPCSGKPFFLGYAPGAEVEVKDEIGEQLVAAGVATQVPAKKSTKKAGGKASA